MLLVLSISAKYVQCDYRNAGGRATRGAVAEDTRYRVALDEICNTHN